MTNHRILIALALLGCASNPGADPMNAPDVASEPLAGSPAPAQQDPPGLPAGGEVLAFDGRVGLSPGARDNDAPATDPAADSPAAQPMDAPSMPFAGASAPAQPSPPVQDDQARDDGPPDAAEPVPLNEPSLFAHELSVHQTVINLVGGITEPPPAPAMMRITLRAWAEEINVVDGEEVTTSRPIKMQGRAIPNPTAGTFDGFTTYELRLAEPLTITSVANAVRGQVLLECKPEPTQELEMNGRSVGHPLGLSPGDTLTSFRVDIQARRLLTPTRCAIALESEWQAWGVPAP